MKKAPIKIRKSMKGVFTAKAKKTGMGVQAYAKKVLGKKSKATAETRAQANFARNFGGRSKRK